MLLLLVVSSTAAVAVDWDEISTTATPVNDTEGQPMVVFTVHLRYDQRPSESSLSYGWTVDEISPDGTTEVLSFYRKTTFSGGGLNLYLASGHVPIVAGNRYVGRVTVDDDVNDLHFETEVDYSAPVSLPVGIRLSAQTGDQVFDLSGVPDEEIEELATACDVLRSEYDLVAEDVTLDDFFSEHASGSEDFPATVFLIPAAALEGEIGPSSGPISFSVERILYIFPVPDRSAVSGLLDQLSVYEVDFMGRVYEGDGSDAVYGAMKVFVGNAAWDTMAAAAEEEDRR